MANLNVTYERMRESASALRAGQAELETRLLQLQSLVEGLVADGFTTTTASGAFAVSYEQFTGGAKTAVGGLEAMARFLDVAAATLQQADEELAARITA